MWPSRSSLRAGSAISGSAGVHPLSWRLGVRRALVTASRLRRGRAMNADAAEAEHFASYLRTRHQNSVITAHSTWSESQDGPTGLRRLWEQSDLPATEFADEVARFYQLPRIHLPQLLAASPLLGQFSRRFLRDMLAFPYRSTEGEIRLAIADPSDTASVHAAEIVLGGPILIDIASFEDIATALIERLGEEDAATTGEEGAP